MNDKTMYVSGVSDESFGDLPVKHLFVTILIAGTISIVMGVMFSSPLFLSTLIPLILVASYAYVTTKVRNSDLSKAKIGDSCYFLGFSFTLISLSVALINLGQNQGGNVDIGAIVGSFGAALSTTLAGLLCRLWFTTLASSFQSSKDKLEEEIESAMRGFSLQLQSLVDEVNMSVKTIGATIGDTNLELNKSYRGQMQDNIKTISSSVDSFSQRLDEIEISKDMVVKPLDIAMSFMIETLNEHGKNMAVVHKNMLEGTSGLSKQIDLSNNLVNGYIEKFGYEFQRIADSQVSVFEKTVEELSESIQKSFVNVSAIKVNLTDNIVNELDVLKNQLESINKLTQANNTALSKTNEINENTARILGISAEKLPIIISGLESASSPISKSSDDINDLIKSLLSFNTNLAETQKTLEGFKNVTSEVTQKLTATSQSVDTASTQLSTDIGNIYSDLAKQLKALRSSAD